MRPTGYVSAGMAGGYGPEAGWGLNTVSPDLAKSVEAAGVREIVA